MSEGKTFEDFIEHFRGLAKFFAEENASGDIEIALTARQFDLLFQDSVFAERGKVDYQPLTYRIATGFDRKHIATLQFEGMALRFIECPAVIDKNGPPITLCEKAEAMKSECECSVEGHMPGCPRDRLTRYTKLSYQPGRRDRAELHPIHPFSAHTTLEEDPVCPICNEEVDRHHEHMRFWIACRNWLGRMHKRCVPRCGIDEWCEGLKPQPLLRRIK